MDSIFNTYFLLFNDRYIFFRYANPNKTRYEIIIGETEESPTGCTFFKYRNTTATT